MFVWRHRVRHAGSKSNGQVSVSFGAATNQMLANSSENGNNTFRLIVTGNDQQRTANTVGSP